MDMITVLVIYGAIFLVMYLILIRPQNKKRKAEEKMRSEVRPGDAIITVGGIMGRVVSVKEDSVLMETGSDRVKLRIRKVAIASNETVHDDDDE